MPFAIPGISVNLMPVVYAILAAAVISAAVWVVDAIGDRREARVWRQINDAITRTNKEVQRFNTLDEQIAAIAYDARVKALAEARKITADNCALSPEQAAALNRIR